MSANRLPAASTFFEVRRRLDAFGYVVLPGVAEGRRLADLRAAFERAARRSDAEGSAGGTPGVRHVERLADKEEVFDGARAEPWVLRAVGHVIRRSFALYLLNGREPLRGAGRQELHADWPPRQPGQPFVTATALWLLDEYRADNGATRVVPGSHRWYKPIPAGMRSAAARHPAEVVVTAPAGAVLLLNGHLWHGGTRNVAGARRRIVQCQYVDRELTRPGEVPPEPPERPRRGRPDA